MIKDLKSLKQLMEMCRKNGVTQIELEGCKINFGELPQPVAVSPVQGTHTAMPTDEEIMFWSSDGGLSEDSQS